MTAEPVVHVRRMEIRRQTPEEEHQRVDRYRVEEVTGDPETDSQHVAIVEIMGVRRRMCLCLRCDSRAMVEEPCGHIEAVRGYVHARGEG